MAAYHNKEQVWAELEEAAAAYFGSANNAAAFQAAGRVFVDFKNSPDLFALCQFVLERSQTPFVQFNAASAMCEAVPREFRLHDRSLFVKLRTDILNYVFHRPNLERYVRQQLFRVIAITTKTGWLADDNNVDPHMAVDGLLFPLFGSEDERVRNAGFLLGSALLEEFSASSKSSAVGLNWEYHQLCKRRFEECIPLPVFESALKAFHALLPRMRAHNASPVLLSTCQTIVELLDRILGWEWSPESTGKTVALAGNFGPHIRTSSEATGTAGDTIKVASVVFPTRWKGVLVNKDVLALFFEAYEVVCQASLSASASASAVAIISSLRQCLLQFAGLSGPVLDDEEAQVAYTRWFIHGLLRLQHLAQTPCHLHFVTTMIRRRLAVVPMKSLAALPQGEMFHLLSSLGNACVESLKRSVAFDPDAAEDEGGIRLLEDAVGEALEGLGQLVDNVLPPLSVSVPDFTPLSFAEPVCQMAVYIAEAYIDSRVELAKASVLVDSQDDEGEGGKDRNMYADQLQRIGIFGRLDPPKILGKLLQAVTGCTARTRAAMSGDVSPHACYGLNADQYLSFLHEYSHWIVLICGFVLADTADGGSEIPLIPDQLMNWSINVCAGPQDVVVELGKAVLGFLDVLAMGPQLPSATTCSPLVVETLYWFLGRWCAAYLLPDESLYKQMSKSLADVFSKASSGGSGTSIIEFILESVKRTFVQWVGEPDVLQQAVAAVEVLTRNPATKSEALKSKKFPELVDFLLRSLGQFPELVHRPLVRAIAIFASGVSETGQENYFDMVKDMIEQRFRAAVGRSDFDRVFQNAEVSTQVIDVIEMFDGLVQATGITTTRRTFEFCSKYFNHLVHVYHVYRMAPDVALAVLGLFESIARCLDLDSLPPPARTIFFNAVLALLNEFKTSVTGQKRSASSAENESVPYADVLAVLNLLSNLMASEFHGYDQPLQPREGGAVKASDVVFFGVSIVIPLIDADMMKLPDLSIRYISAVSCLVEFHADKLVALPTELLTSLMATLEFGVNHYVADVASKSYQSIAPLALFCLNEEKRKGHASVAHLIPPLNNFLRVTLDCLLYKDFDSELVDSAGEALFALICCCRVCFREATHQIVSSQSLPELQHRLAAAFASLDATVPPDLPEVLTLRQLKSFREALFDFLMDVRGVLRVR